MHLHLQARVSLLARVAPLPPTEVRCAQALWRGLNRSAAAGRAASAALQPAFPQRCSDRCGRTGSGVRAGCEADGLEVIDACCHAWDAILATARGRPIVASSGEKSREKSQQS